MIIGALARVFPVEHEKNVLGKFLKFFLDSVLDFY